VHDLQVLNETERTIKLNELASRVILPYSLMAGALVALAVMVRFSALPEIEAAQEDNREDAVASGKTSIAQFPHLIFGVIALFLYVGVEVIAGDTIGTFGQSQGIPLSEAKNFTSFTLSAMVIGYIIGIVAIPKYLSQATALAASAVVGILFSIIAINTSGYTSVLFIALLGLANALVWPAIWPLAIDGLGKFTKTGSALLIMAIAGGALLPLVYGSLADIATIGQQKAYYLMVPCYAFMLFYALKGYKLKGYKV
jgi:glucose/galactose transporter